MPSELGDEVEVEAEALDDLDELGEEPDLEDDLEPDLEDEDEDLDDDAAVDADEEEEGLGEDAVGAPRAPAVAPEGEEGTDEDEEEEEDDDVEASLDVILKERLVVEDEEEEDEPADVEDRGDGALRVLPKQPGEFVCQSCFLVKSQGQLADGERMLCRDCV